MNRYEVVAMNISNKLPSLQVGDVVRIGGKGPRGFDARIEKIEDRLYSMRNGRCITIPHGRITRPALPEVRSRTGIITTEARDARTYWEPLWHIKRPKSALKKAG